MPSDDDLPGAIFWADSKDSVGQEDKGIHPWIVISEPKFARREKLVVAVPMTSNPFEYYDTEVQVEASEIRIRNDVSKKLDPNKLNGWIKCAKPRHWSIERVGEVIGVATPFLVNKIRVVVADVIATSAIFSPPPSRGRGDRKGRR